MRRFVLSILFLTIADIAYARPDVRTMSCAQASALVRQSGAVVLTTGRYTYDRFVTGQSYCYPPDVIQRAWVGTADTNQCNIGYTCEQRIRPRFFGRGDD